MASGKLCWMTLDPSDRQKTTLDCVSIANNGDKPETLTDGVSGFEVSADGTKMLVHKQNDLFVFDSSVSAGLQCSRHVPWVYAIRHIRRRGASRRFLLTY